ncbi:hypothetical protein MXD61_04530 [Frankia sp. AgPm24]|uniref:hypothetical protein n=1 Tax=Frankia sp. AgPm24 TaxID=631128 RepID=UPI00200C204A|nr:hypothetical protein [Frankia sp. AgPm24]MCK9921176.1 hypothetical protein [Frankia sp. AgPm24]
MLHDLMARVADELDGPWAASVLPNDAVSLHTPDHDLLVVRQDPDGRLVFHGIPASGLGSHWPRDGKNPLRHRITVSPAKSPARIASELSHRLLPAYRITLAVALAAHKAARHERADATRALAAISRLLDTTVEDRTVRLTGPSSHLTGTITIAAGEATFHLRLPTHHATTLAQAVRPFRAPR